MHSIAFAVDVLTIASAPPCHETESRADVLDRILRDVRVRMIPFVSKERRALLAVAGESSRLRRAPRRG
jgi:hypothetical protein